MVDVALSLLALIAGGVSLELFAPAQRSADESLAESQADDVLAGNPS